MGKEIKVLKNKEVSDALHMLLHCALKDKEYETQKEQFKIVYSYIEQLEKESADKEKCYNECFCEYKHYKQYESIPKEAIRKRLKKFKNIKTGDLTPSDCEVWSVLRNLLGE